MKQSGQSHFTVPHLKGRAGKLVAGQDRGKKFSIAVGPVINK